MVTLPGKDVLGEEYKDRQRSFGSPLRAQRRAAAKIVRRTARSEVRVKRAASAQSQRDPASGVRPGACMSKGVA
jgi:hypothetical protein